MRVLPGLRAEDFNEATGLAYAEAGSGDMAGTVAGLFDAMVEADALQGEAEKNINAALHHQYRGKTEWRIRERWYIPVPLLRYDARDTPRLIFDVISYLVAPLTVEPAGNLRFVTVVGPLSKPETLILPMVLLQAILDDDMTRFVMLERSASRTTWEIPGTRPVQLPNDFFTKLMEILKRKSVVTWLSEFGLQGRIVAPLVAGSLLGMRLRGAASPQPAAKQTWTTELLVSDLEALSYPIKEAKEMVTRAASHLRTDLTEEEALRIVLQQAGKGELL